MPGEEWQQECEQLLILSSRKQREMSSGVLCVLLLILTETSDLERVFAPQLHLSRNTQADTLSSVSSR